MRSRGTLLAATLVAVLAAATAVPAGAFVDDDPVLHTLTDEGPFYGWAVSELTDVDADGVTDWIAGSIGADDFSGFTQVVSGATGTELFRFPGAPAELHGYAIADVGDVDADGTHDIVAGAPGFAGPGTVYVYSGADGSTLLTLHGEANGDFFGSAVADAGDVDGDGHADVLVGAENNDASGAESGRAYVFSGVDGTLIRTLDAEGPGDLFGSATDAVADLDGDGIDEHVIGARDAGAEGRGEVYVFRGGDGSRLYEFEASPTGENLGYFFVAGLRDVDGDGTADIYGADFDDAHKGVDTGKAFVWSGADGSLIHEWVGKQKGVGLGPGRGAGDVDGDGHEDLIIGSWLDDFGGADAGKVTVYSGADGKRLRTIVGDQPGHSFGFDAVGLGDTDGDGLIDFLVSAASGNHVYVMAGVPEGDAKHRR